jgi:D-glycero-alpha-D-manno-heptose 1-phosphate guanylyltransferase
MDRAKEAVIIAGGFGTRIARVVKDVPKPMAPVNGKPFLHYVLTYALKQHIQRAVLAVGYKAEIIRRYFGDCFDDMELVYSQENTPLGTGGAVKKGARLCKRETIFILNGDTFFDVDLEAMLTFHLDKEADVTIATKEMRNFDRYGTVETRDDKIVAFNEKQKRSAGNINGGIYVFRKNYLENTTGDSFSLEKHVFEKYVDRDGMYAFGTDGYFIDIGVPEDYERAQRELYSTIFQKL